MIDPWLPFLGRLHPVIVHLPIGFVVVLVLLMLASPRGARPGVPTVERIILWALLLTSIAAVAFGLAMAAQGSYAGELLGLHRVLGFIMAATAVVTLIAHYTSRRLGYALALSTVVLFTAATGHFGGSLTHGRDYLVNALPEHVQALIGHEPPQTLTIAQRPSDPGQAELYAHLVEPIFAARCIDCHGPERVEGELRLDSYQATVAGGESGSIVTGEPIQTAELIRRLHVPLHHDDRMPPESRTQLTSDEIALLEWWIMLGVPDDAHLRDYHAQAPDAVVRYVNAQFNVDEDTAWAAVPDELPLDQAIALADQLGIMIMPIAADEQGIEVVARHAGSRFNDEHLARLAPLAAHVRRLDLANTAVSDEGLEIVARMYQLERLDLSNTAITDAAMPHIATLPRLSYLNVYGTGVSDAALPAIEQLPSLRQVYLWQSEVTPDAARDLADRLSTRVQPRIERIKTEIHQLERRMQSKRVAVHMGAEPLDTQAEADDSDAPDSDTPAATAAATPVNSTCPVRGTAASAAYVLEYDGQLIAFCCGTCRAQFEQDPTAYIDALETDE